MMKKVRRRRTLRLGSMCWNRAWKYVSYEQNAMQTHHSKRTHGFRVFRAIGRFSPLRKQKSCTNEPTFSSRASQSVPRLLRSGVGLLWQYGGANTTRNARPNPISGKRKASSRKLRLDASFFCFLFSAFGLSLSGPWMRVVIRLLETRSRQVRINLRRRNRLVSQ